MMGGTGALLLMCLLLAIHKRTAGFLDIGNVAKDFAEDVEKGSKEAVAAVAVKPFDPCPAAEAASKSLCETAVWGQKACGGFKHCKKSGKDAKGCAVWECKKKVWLIVVVVLVVLLIVAGVVAGLLIFFLRIKPKKDKKKKEKKKKEKEEKEMKKATAKQAEMGLAPQPGMTPQQGMPPPQGMPPEQGMPPPY